MGKKGKSKGKDRSTESTAGLPKPETAATPLPDAAQVATRLTTSAIHLLRRLHREDAALGLTSTRMSALSVLVLGGPRTLGQLAEAEGVTPPSMTRLMTAMEADGLVTRSPSATDGRLVILSATARGAELLQQGRDGRVAVLAGMLEALPESEQRTLDGAAGILEELLRPVRRA